MGFLSHILNSQVIPYVTDEQADAVTKNPQLKLLFRLCKFYILDEGVYAFKQVLQA
jgi:hypothetical protein